MYSKAFLNTVFCLLLLTFYTLASENHEKSSSHNHPLQQLNLTCSDDTECHLKIGNSSVCYKDSCVCDLGFTLLTSNKSTTLCTLYQCNPFRQANQTTTTATTASPVEPCWKVFQDTFCSVKDLRCVCDIYHQLDKRSQRCVGKAGPEKEHFPYGWLIGGLVFAGLLVGGVAIYYTKIHRRRRGYN